MQYNTISSDAKNLRNVVNYTRDAILFLNKLIRLYGKWKSLLSVVCGLSILETSLV